MKTKLILIIFMTCCISFSWAQDSISLLSDSIGEFDISKYKSTTIKRNTLRYDAGIMRGGTSSLSGKIGRFISDEKKQIRIYSQLNKAFEIDEIRKLSNHLNYATLGANIKFFNKKDYFLEAGLDNSVILLNPGNGLPIRSIHQLALGFGIGRIDFVNDAVIARRVLKEIRKSNQIKRIPTKSEFEQLVKVIAQIKDERYFENRSYSNFEPHQIVMLLDYLGITQDAVETISRTVHQSFKYEPVIDRLAGFELKFLVSGGLTQKGLLERISGERVRLGVSWDYHKYINDFWDWNVGITAFSGQRNFEVSPIIDLSIDKVSLSFQNQIHYLPNPTFRITLLNFVSSVPAISFGDIAPGYNRDLSLYTGLEIEILTSRRTSITFNINRIIRRYEDSSNNWGVMLKF